MTEAFNTKFGRGFGPSSRILLADGSRKAISSLTPSDILWTPMGPSKIRALVTCESYQVAQSMCWIDGVAVTPYHPCRNKENAMWGQAMHRVIPSECYMPKVYNLVLHLGHSVDLGGTEFATLAHGGSPYRLDMHDPYFGTRRVIDDLKKQPGWEEGLPIYQNVKVIRHPVTGEIDGWVESIGIGNADDWR